VLIHMKWDIIVYLADNCRSGSAEDAVTEFLFHKNNNFNDFRYFHGEKCSVLGRIHIPYYVDQKVTNPRARYSKFSLKHCFLFQQNCSRCCRVLECEIFLADRKLIRNLEIWVREDNYLTGS
jgi:hypothetical protein